MVLHFVAGAVNGLSNANSGVSAASAYTGAGGPINALWNGAPIVAPPPYGSVRAFLSSKPPPIFVPPAPAGGSVGAFLNSTPVALVTLGVGPLLAAAGAAVKKLAD